MKKNYSYHFLYIFILSLLLNQPIKADIHSLYSDFLPQDTNKKITTVRKIAIEKKDTSKVSKTDDTGKNIQDILDGLNKNKRVISWKLNPTTYNLELDEGVDTLLFFPHFEIPLHKKLETTTYLGNIGSPIKSDHFFSQHPDYPFLFSRYYLDYTSGVLSHKQYNVKRPLSTLGYSMGGKRSQLEQTLRVFHTQNVNKYLNVGLNYDNFGTKGTYKYQQTRDNFFNAFSSYYKNNLSFQGNFAYYRIRNKENGGLTSDYFIQDTIIETELVPFKLKAAESEVIQRSISALIGYDLLTRTTQEKDQKGEVVAVKKPVFSLKALVDINRHSRTYTDGYKNDTSHYSFYKNFYISKTSTNDSVMLLTYESMIMGELSQLAKFPGLPGLRFWLSDIRGKYYYFKPTDFILNREDDKIYSNHFGVATFSYSPYLSYNGSLRLYLNGYRAGDKELFGNLLISPWKSLDLPYVKGTIEITEREPDIFTKSYFSNHFKWVNSFNKQKRFMLGGSIGAEKWRFEAGYNLIHINDFIYFDTLALPEQVARITITSAYIQKDLKLGGLHFTNRVVWQANTNPDVLSLPTFSIFSSLFFEHELVKNVLRGQIGFNVWYRTKFYADNYSPATGQFYNQREKKIGNYPYTDAFINLKWKRAILYFKFDHVNQGVPNSEYFAALHYPFNRRIFKIGVSWIFYD